MMIGIDPTSTESFNPRKLFFESKIDPRTPNISPWDQIPETYFSFLASDPGTPFLTSGIRSQSEEKTDYFNLMIRIGSFTRVV